MPGFDPKATWQVTVWGRQYSQYMLTYWLNSEQNVRGQRLSTVHYNSECCRARHLVAGVMPVFKAQRLV